MWEAPAKALVRSYFYRQFLPSNLPASLLRSGDYLVLLGDSEKEEGLLDELGVAPYRIYSVEHDLDVWMRQSKRAQTGELQVVLYYGELIEFITNYLQTNQRFLVLNLDICGAYMNAIDPVLYTILLFAL